MIEHHAYLLFAVLIAAGVMGTLALVMLAQELVQLRAELRAARTERQEQARAICDELRALMHAARGY